MFAFIVGKRCVPQYLIESRGIIADGTAVSTVYRGSFRGGSYFVSYDFAYNGLTYHGTSRADRDWAKGTPMPAPIKVRFIPSNPDLNLPDVAGITPLWLSILFMLVLLSLAVYNGAKAISVWRVSSNQQEL
jgi:hypothetical protein